MPDSKQKNGFTKRKTKGMDGIIDEIDRQILFELSKDGKQSPVRMKIVSKKKEMSHTGIKNRIDNLMQSNILKIQGNVNINIFNCQIAFIRIEFQLYNSLFDYIKKYEKCPRIFLISRITGQFHLNIGVFGKDLDDLNNFFNYCILAEKENIKSSEIIFASELYKPKFMPLDIFNIDIRDTGCGKSCTTCNAFSKHWCFGCDFLL